MIQFTKYTETFILHDIAGFTGMWCQFKSSEHSEPEQSIQEQNQVNKMIESSAEKLSLCHIFKCHNSNFRL
jgi:hypothetical protein